MLYHVRDSSYCPPPYLMFGNSYHTYIPRHSLTIFTQPSHAVLLPLFPCPCPLPPFLPCYPSVPSTTFTVISLWRQQVADAQERERGERRAWLRQWCEHVGRQLRRRNLLLRTATRSQARRVCRAVVEAWHAAQLARKLRAARVRQARDRFSGV